MPDSNVEDTERPRIDREPPTLEQRLGRVLAGNGGNTSSQELQDLLNEVEAALVQTQADADRYHAECLDLDCADLVTAKHNEREAMLRHLALARGPATDRRQTQAHASR